MRTLIQRSGLTIVATIAAAVTVAALYGCSADSNEPSANAASLTASQQQAMSPGSSGTSGTSALATPSPSPSASASASPSGNPTPVAVSIPSGSIGKGPAAYGQNPLVVPVGTTVTWTNNDSIPHTATSDTGVFDSGTLTQGQSYSFQFTQAGRFPYHCTIHGAASMSGVIQVQ